MKVEILPIGTSAVAFKGETTCFVARLDGVTVLIDCGTGTAKGLTDVGISMIDVDAVFVSHVHADHMQALPSLVFTRSVQARAAEREVPPLKVLAGEGVLSKASEAVELFYPDREFEVDWVNRLTIPGNNGELDLVPFAVDHTVGSFGLRISHNGRPVVGYSSDTELCDALLDGLRDVKVAIIEAFGTSSQFGDMTKAAKHLSALDAAKVAAAVNPEVAIPYHMHAPYQTPGGKREELVLELNSEGVRAGLWIYPETTDALVFDV